MMPQALATLKPPEYLPFFRNESYSQQRLVLSSGQQIEAIMQESATPPDFFGQENEYQPCKPAYEHARDKAEYKGQHRAYPQQNGAEGVGPEDKAEARSKAAKTEDRPEYGAAAGTEHNCADCHRYDQKGYGYHPDVHKAERRCAREYDYGAEKCKQDKPAGFFRDSGTKSDMSLYLRTEHLYRCLSLKKINNHYILSSKKLQY